MTHFVRDSEVVGYCREPAQGLWRSEAGAGRERSKCLHDLQNFGRRDLCGYDVGAFPI